MMSGRAAVLVAVLSGLIPGLARAQDLGWAADISVGYAGFVDDSTKNYWLVGGALRRYVTPRLSIGPEIVVMSNNDRLRDRTVLLTGNVVFDAAPSGVRVTPFLVGGLGVFWGRDQLRGGPYWSSDPAFTGGAGLRARVSNAWTAAVEYRIGWELHQRISGSAGVRW